MIVTIRTDKPEAELGLFSSDGEKKDYITWEAHRALSETILDKIELLLSRSQLGLKDLNGVVFYSGPGSFTGLRIGASVANSLAYGLSIKAAQSGGEEWIEQGIISLSSSSKSKFVVPEYGAEPHITAQKK